MPSERPIEGLATGISSRQRLCALRSELALLHEPWPLLVGILGLLILLVPVVAWLTVRWSESHAYQRLAAQGRERLTLYGEMLHSELAKSRNIPVVLSSDRQVIELLADPEAAKGEGRIAALDRRLQELNAELGASAIYVLDSTGLTLAASNWAEGSGSFVGQRFAFRPYFLAAVHGHPGSYFALGMTSNQPGHYNAMPVSKGGGVLGAVVVKTSMDRLERGWSGGAERVFVTDRFGIVFITNIPAWRFHSLNPLDAESMRSLKASRQYGNERLPPLGLVAGDPLTSIDGHAYVMVSQPLADGQGWTLHVLMQIGDARARARDLGLLAVAGVGLTVLVVYFFIHRARMRRRYTRELEERVLERTAALMEKQDELVQAAKLAALGQMSAGMAHEINQPLAAIRSYADNARTLIDLGRNELVRENLGEIADLTERMARMTGQLKQFARKSPGSAEPVAVTAVIDGVLALMASRLRSDGVELEWLPPGGALKVWGEEVRLQQVLVNLLRNALDAMREQVERRLTIGVATDDRQVHVMVRDNGPGIASEVLPRLFEPFFTTKQAGDGLGLGLSISEGIVRDLGGQLVAGNHPGGGAVFTITLSRAEAA